MATDGERLKALLAEAKERIILCAPFVKESVLRTILAAIPSALPLTVVTRWRPDEVAVGISDLKVFDVVSEMGNAELFLLDNLHAKLYVADGNCLVGSANLTASALGWSKNSNVELLMPAKTDDFYVALLLKRLKNARMATAEYRQEIQAKADSLESINLIEGEAMTSEKDYRHLPWLPRCAAPDRLYEIYMDASTDVVVKGTRDDGLADIRDIDLPEGLSQDAFQEAVKSSLLHMSVFSEITREVSKGLTDAQGQSVIARARPECDKEYVEVQWRIVRDWVAVYFQDQIEVAPASFVTRLKR
ncbi:MAG: phospholipase D family protein [Gammaproteobacteria bacterium]|nr:phospholipase D family protein [Gammaproteobacteria bacterium]